MRNSSETKVHYKGKNGDEDFVVYAESQEDVQNWKGDKSIPLAQVVGLFKVFVTHKHGAQGTLDQASKSQLANEFGEDKNEEDIIQVILQEGDIQTSSTSERQGNTNDSKGSMAN
ncbi:shwachman-bodian-diamond syndrome protein [Rutstroemia sp. NJR-2017a WRK4]|nr:shwachman-bodian-diamond syndrome protein [Rutstroemia sp. NJR-2017a WRK4]